MYNVVLKVATITGLIGLAATPIAAPISLFETSRSRSAELVLNEQAVQELLSDTPEVLLSQVPLIAGDAETFVLRPVQVFADDALVTVHDEHGSSSVALSKDISAWSGQDINQSSRTLFLTIDSKRQFHAIITGDESTSPTVIAPAAANTYRLFESAIPQEKFCELVHTAPADSIAAPAAAALSPSDTIYEAEMTIDIGYKLTQKLGSSGVTPQRYITDLFGALTTIYRRDLGAVLKVKNLHVWTSTDPFGSALGTYRSYVEQNRVASSFDLAHLLDHNPGTGGVAYLDVLGSQGTYRVGVSNVDGTGQFPATLSTYYWDINVTAHEIGHNFGSDHTHCYSPPIDCCVTGCPGCSSQQVKIGTIMSYCHLHMYSGGGITLNFHSRVASLVRGKILASPLLTALPRQGDLVISGKEDASIVHGDSTPRSLDGTKFATQLPGAMAVTSTFKLKNVGNEPITLGTPAVSISGDSVFTIQPLSLPAQLFAGASADFNVRFDPTTTGDHSAVITVSTNDPDTPYYTFSVSGRVSPKGQPKIFTNSGAVVIPDNSGQGTWVEIPVSGVTGALMNLEFSINGSNCTNEWFTGIQHSRVSDLRLTLQSPSGTVVTIFDRPGSSGGAGAHFCKTYFADNPDFPLINGITAAGAPYSSNFRPQNSFSVYHGEEPNGTWTVRCYDSVSGYQGNMWSVSVIATGEAPSEVDNWSLY